MRLCHLLFALCAARLAAWGSLTVEVTQGEGAIHNLASTDFVQPAVRVATSDGRPAANASVAFLLPETGPGGTFRGERVLVVTANETGEAAATGLRPNRQPGNWEIRVTVSYQGTVERLAISQINAVPTAFAAARRANRPLWLAGLLGAGAALGVALGTGVTGGKSSPAPPSPSPAPPVATPAGTLIRPGAGAIGPP